MKRKLFILMIFLLALKQVTYSQAFNKNIDKDTYLSEILKNIPEEKRDALKKQYEEGDEQSKEFLLFMFSMPRSSKKELVENYENNSKEIITLKKRYSKLVPDSLIVSIEFNAVNKLIRTSESIDLKIYRKNPNGQPTVVKQEWKLESTSEKLNEMLTILSWNHNTLKEIKKILDAANCISIENGNITTIGFARSGMGKYSYKVFDKALSANAIDEYNDGCTFIFYKDNIVLEYGGGAIGSQCFPDE
ncbi:MAG TPA: hypothetical protein VLZ83_01840 [Edaphocola sp.]|nr:hypothetical protein [Edaphocola sp.]